MKILELFKQYPNAKTIVKEWFLKKMILSFEEDNVPEEFKEAMLTTGISDEHLATLIEKQPRILFDVFDENKIFICISVWTKTPGNFENAEFGIALNATNKNNNNFSTRKEAELVAIEEAFELLEESIKNK